MHVLVTGANGHLGYNLVEQLLAGGHRVRASVRTLDDPSRTARLRALGDVELVEARLDRPDQLRAAMEGVECLFHAAAAYVNVHGDREREILDSSIRGAQAAVTAAADAGVRKVVRRPLRGLRRRRAELSHDARDDARDRSIDRSRCRG